MDSAMDEPELEEETEQEVDKVGVVLSEYHLVSECCCSNRTMSHMRAQEARLSLSEGGITWMAWCRC